MRSMSQRPQLRTFLKNVKSDHQKCTHATNNVHSPEGKQKTKNEPQTRYENHKHTHRQQLSSRERNKKTYIVHMQSTPTVFVFACSTPQEKKKTLSPPCHATLAVLNHRRRPKKSPNATRGEARQEVRQGGGGGAVNPWEPRRLSRPNTNTHGNGPPPGAFIGNSEDDSEDDLTSLPDCLFLPRSLRRCRRCGAATEPFFFAARGFTLYPCATTNPFAPKRERRRVP